MANAVERATRMQGSGVSDSKNRAAATATALLPVFSWGQTTDKGMEQCLLCRRGEHQERCQRSHWVLRVLRLEVWLVEMETATPSCRCLILGVVSRMNGREWRGNQVKALDRVRAHALDREDQDSRGNRADRGCRVRAAKIERWTRVLCQSRVARKASEPDQAVGMSSHCYRSR